jgi:hypothetical protein
MHFIDPPAASSLASFQHVFLWRRLHVMCVPARPPLSKAQTSSSHTLILVVAFWVRLLFANESSGGSRSQNQITVTPTAPILGWYEMRCLDGVSSRALLAASSSQHFHPNPVLQDRDGDGRWTPMWPLTRLPPSAAGYSAKKTYILS